MLYQTRDYIQDRHNLESKYSVVQSEKINDLLYIRDFLRKYDNEEV